MTPVTVRNNLENVATRQLKVSMFILSDFYARLLLIIVILVLNHF